MKKIILLLLFIPSLLAAQSAKRDSIWMPFKYFVGSWKGEGGGEPGIGQYERSYEWVLGKRFIEIKNKSTYAATDKNPKGEIHEDIGYFSYDGGRKTFVLRQFHEEGFVNQFVLDSISPDGKMIVFMTESIENIPAGYRARESYQIVSNDEFIETFEIAEPGKDFAIYSSVKLKRQK